MKRTLFALLLLTAPARAADNPNDAATVANGFYTTYLALPRSGGIPDATGRVRYAPLLSARLNKLIDDAAAAEARFHTQNKASPPLVEGDLFSSLFEGITSYRLGACTVSGKTASCVATLTHADPGQKPVTWNDALLLVNTPAGWKVDDIAYKAGFQFGNTGLLSDTLKMVLAEAP